MSALTNVFSGSIQNVFGNGLLGTAVTGLVRIPAFMANCTAVLMVGELAIRGLSNTVSLFGFKPASESFLERTATEINQSGIRPYRDLSNRDLAVRALGFAALGIVGSEFVRIAGGTAPAIYNKVLALLGPIRIAPTPYCESIAPLLARIW